MHFSIFFFLVNTRTLLSHIHTRAHTHTHARAFLTPIRFFPTHISHSLSLSFFFSLSHKHTRTRTHTLTRKEREREANTLMIEWRMKRKCWIDYKQQQQQRGGKHFIRINWANLRSLSIGDNVIKELCPVYQCFSLKLDKGETIL